MRFATTIALILVLSAVGLTYEIAAGRVLAPYFGTSLLTWTTVIATVLAGFSLGSAWGGFIAEREGAVRTVRAALVATGVLMAVSPALLGLIHASGARGTGGMMLSVLVAFFPASVAVTLPSPWLAKRAVEARPGREGSSLGIVLAAGSVGAIFGAILAGFVALPLIGSTATFAACGVVALLCLLPIKGAGPERPILLSAAGVVAIAGIAGTPACEYESGLSCIHVSRHGAEVRLHADRTMQAAERLDGEEALALDYTRWIWARMEADLGPAPEVLFVGGGGYSLPARLLAARDDARAVTVEIDPLVTEVAREHLPVAGEIIAREAGPDGRLALVHADGRVFLNETTGRFDAAVMDAFSSNSVPAHLVTRESFGRLATLVSGPVYVNLIDRPDGPLLRGVHAILTELWPVVEVAQGPVQSTGRANIVLAAGHAPFGAAPGLPGDYLPAPVTPARAFTDDRGWVGHR